MVKLKALQDCLGRFNDLSVQQEKLLEYSYAHKSKPNTVHLAIGGMVGVLAQEQIEERYRVFEQLKSLQLNPYARSLRPCFLM